METTLEMVFGNANRMNAVAHASVDSVVTLPPYPMIKMWEHVFAKHNPDVGDALRRAMGDWLLSLCTWSWIRSGGKFTGS